MRARRFIYHVHYTVHGYDGTTGDGDGQFSIPKKKLTEPSIERLNDFLKEHWKEKTGRAARVVIIKSYQLIRESRGRKI
ncbi:hypothetical protein Spock_245 [Bacillus phage Spock]|uniref:Uncharacterized protein n=1 Tax=Bacillus phage Spock TaxID=1406791 RepID=U5PXB8_9CAUD|nr:hypothetical protein Spock_245 [Bacillus phage Spock]AGY48645.1 hypothetical protein Spock_245 [Bacillus phage Spock]